MNLLLPFLIAQCSTLILAVIALWTARPLLRTASATFADHFKIYAWAYIKCLCLMTLAFGGTFKETWSPVTAAMASQWAVWDWIIHLAAPVLSAVAVLSAFLDRSMQAADLANDEKKKSVTNPPFSPPPAT